ncbi:alpha 1,2-mannosyltransferase 2.4.1 [Tieghemiomyces parasiticus]|uniref:Alpha 1,2-mannosyltransferase 2.4.1 n=1 Tax=Tieghemiomyces parasiticus TaxID=78921 RepID=A0A9W8AI68_9FUNG|nr:alpha 1,2-mannosyltransferase 2.4.1 [Tieghemiomyces parasiticus]
MGSILNSTTYRVVFILGMTVFLLHLLFTFGGSRWSGFHGTSSPPNCTVLVAPSGVAMAEKAVATPLVTSKISPPTTTPGKRANAVFVILARNHELFGLGRSLQQLEQRFNHQFNYPYVFLNDEPFDDDFKRVAAAVVSGNVSFGLIPKEHWSYPSWIDLNKAAAGRKKLKNIIYGPSESYRHMCRFNSGFFFHHPLLAQYEYYWRVEPDVDFTCNIDYDPFVYMQERSLKYGFTISLHEIPQTVATLWKTTKDFMAQHPEYVSHPNTLEWVVDKRTGDYNLCHFWSNFEIANLNLLRSERYQAYFDHLDQAGGFFYERWGDAPVHSLAAAMFLRKDEIHFFEDIGYRHSVFENCPTGLTFNLQNCNCNSKRSVNLQTHTCTGDFLKLSPQSDFNITTMKQHNVVQ